MFHDRLFRLESALFDFDKNECGVELNIDMTVCRMNDDEDVRRTSKPHLSGLKINVKYRSIRFILAGIECA
jgi:hypothetical protein